jgi:hypothetical protein
LQLETAQDRADADEAGRFGAWGRSVVCFGQMSGGDGRERLRGVTMTGILRTVEHKN